MAASSGEHVFYLLNGLGETPGDCSIIHPVNITSESINFKGESYPSSRIEILNVSIEMETDIISSAPSIPDVAHTYCIYNTMKGQIEFIEERSIFRGYLIHRLSFTLDEHLPSQASKFKVFRKSVQDSDYQFVSDLNREEGKSTYSVDYKPLYSRDYTYKVVAVNDKSEVLDLLILK